MSQNDFSIANQTSAALRADLNNALQALASQSSGSTAPATTYANMLWYDTGTNILKMRTEADDGWINMAYLDQGAGAFRIIANTQVTDTSGTQIGLLGAQLLSAWTTGTGTLEGLVSPAKMKAAIEALAPSSITKTTGTAPYYGARAWGAVTVSGVTPTIAASANIASVVRTGVGVYVVTFSTDMPDTNYVMQSSAEDNDFAMETQVQGRTTSGFTIYTFDRSAATALRDVDFMSFSVFR